MIQYKTTNKLFNGQYQYKVVLIVPGSSMFRTGKMDVTYRLLNEVKLDDARSTLFFRGSVKSPEDLSYSFKLCNVLGKLENIHIRVESPWVAVYTNSKKDVDRLIRIDQLRVKYVSQPAENTTLEEGTIVLPKVDFEFKVTLGRTRKEHSAFIEWAESNTKVKLTNSCVKHLLKNESWGGSYFYITGEKNLLVAKMHLGGDINKIERVIKA